MGYARFPNSFRGVNKRKLVLAAVVVGTILLVILLVAGAIIFAIINALLGQADSGIGKPVSGLITTLWNTALEFIQALWKQIIANPLQLLMGGGN